MEDQEPTCPTCRLTFDLCECDADSEEPTRCHACNYPFMFCKCE